MFAWSKMQTSGHMVSSPPLPHTHLSSRLSLPGFYISVHLIYKAQQRSQPWLQASAHKGRAAGITCRAELGITLTVSGMKVQFSLPLDYTPGSLPFFSSFLVVSIDVKSIDAILIWWNSHYGMSHEGPILGFGSWGKRRLSSTGPISFVPTTSQDLSGVRI